MAFQFLIAELSDWKSVVIVVVVVSHNKYHTLLSVAR